MHIYVYKGCPRKNFALFCFCNPTKQIFFWDTLYYVIPVEVGADAIEDLAAELVLLPLQRVELEHRLLGQVIALLNILNMSDESS